VNGIALPLSDLIIVGLLFAIMLRMK